jgi:hypothetical protein
MQIFSYCANIFFHILGFVPLMRPLLHTRNGKSYPLIRKFWAISRLARELLVPSRN